MLLLLLRGYADMKTLRHSYLTLIFKLVRKNPIKILFQISLLLKKNLID